MPRNRVQHQKGLSDDGFEQRYPDEAACRKAWFAWRWPEGFKCPRCASTKYSEIQGRQLLQCQRCRHQTSLIAGTVLQGTKLPMRVWFRAMHLLGQGKKGISNIELGRRLGLHVAGHYQKVSCVPRKAVNGRGDNHVAGGERLHQLGKLRPVGRGAGDLLTIHFFAPGRLQLAHCPVSSWSAVEIRGWPSTMLRFWHRTVEQKSDA